MTKDSGGPGGQTDGDKEREWGGEGGNGGRGSCQGRTPHVSPKTLGRPRCYARTSGPTSGHPNLL